MTAIAIIPARGGSKGVPRKNARLLGGLPLVSHTVRAALTSGVFDTVAVSTEDAEIARIAEEAGAQVVLRPSDLATDAALSEPVMSHALGVLEGLRGQRYDSVWLLQPTSPLRTADDIRSAAELLGHSGVDSVVSMAADHSFYWSAVPGSDHLVEPSYDLSARPRRQSLAPKWRENGAIYAVMRAVWDREGVRAAGDIAAYVMPADRSIEVDTEADWLLVQSQLDAVDSTCVSGEPLAGVKAIAFDFDGVMTDNSVAITQDGTESVVCSRSDGWGIAKLRALDVPMVVISTEKNPVVSARCAKLSLDCLQGVADKPAALEGWLRERGIAISACAFVGNDENDLRCLELAGVAIVPSDAHESARRAAAVVLGARGGHGAVRELCDLLVKQMRGERNAKADEGGHS